MSSRQVIEDVGEVGIDPEASPGVGPYYVQHYATGYDTVGFDTEAEALEELRYVEETFRLTA